MYISNAILPQNKPSVNVDTWWGCADMCRFRRTLKGAFIYAPLEIGDASRSRLSTGKKAYFFTRFLFFLFQTVPGDDLFCIHKYVLFCRVRMYIRNTTGDQNRGTDVCANVYNSEQNKILRKVNLFHRL